MKGTSELSIAVFLLSITSVKAQSSCFIYPSDGTEIDVGERPFINPAFCNKECRCIRTYPDYESGIPSDQVVCGCSYVDKTTSELYCLVVGETGLIPELGVCECTQQEVLTLSCEPYRPTNSPLGPPSLPPTVSPISDSEVSEPTPTIPDSLPNNSSNASLRCNLWWLSTTFSACVMYLADFE